MEINKGALCNECRKLIEIGENYYRRKHDDDIFCSRECLNLNVIDNIEVRIEKLELTED